MENIMPDFDNTLPDYAAYNASAKTRVRFYQRKVLNEQAFIETGETVYDLKDYCYIPLQGKDCWDQPVREVDKTRFPAEYAAYKQGSKGFDGTTATLLKHWDAIPQEKIYELIAEGFQTVEEIANCPDGGLSRIGLNGSDYRKKAKEFLENKSKNSGEARIKALENLVEKLIAQGAELPKPAVVEKAKKDK